MTPDELEAIEQRAEDQEFALRVWLSEEDLAPLRKMPGQVTEAVRYAVDQVFEVCEAKQPKHVIYAFYFARHAPEPGLEMTFMGKVES